MLGQSWVLGAKEGLGLQAFEPPGNSRWPMAPTTGLVEQLPRKQSSPGGFRTPKRDSGASGKRASWTDRKTGAQGRDTCLRPPGEYRDGACRDFDPES